MQSMLKSLWARKGILAPASPLIGISSYAQSADQTAVITTCTLLLWQVNQCYGSPDQVRVGSESEALAAATTAIRSDNLRVPKN